jgi:hypothetical protein
MLPTRRPFVALLYRARMRAHALLVATFVILCLGLYGADALAEGEGAAKAPAETSADGGSPGTDARRGAARAGGADSEKAIAEARARLQAGRRARLEGLDLTDAQRRAIDELPDRRAAWHAEHRERLDAIRDRLVLARADGDLQTVKELTDERQQIFATRPGLDDILTLEQQQLLRASGPKGAGAAKRGAGTGPARARGKAPAHSPEMLALQAQMREARLSGDVERVKELQTQIRMLKQAVRDARASERDAAGEPAPATP